MTVNSVYKALMAVVMLAVTLPAWAGEAPVRVVWDKTPITVRLVVDEERLVTFPAPVKVGIPAHLAGRLRTLSVDGTVYWLPRAPFPPTRVKVQEVESGRTYLIDLVAVEAREAEPPMVVHLPDAPPAEKEKEQTKEPLTIPGLVRYAAQQLYAPRRLVVNRMDISPRRLSVTWPVALIRGGEVETVPVAAWSDYNGRFVTALRVTNRLDRQVFLDPRKVRGDWIAAAFHETTLPAGGETHLYLISKKPFAAAAMPWSMPPPPPKGKDDADRIQYTGLEDLE